MKKFEQIIFSKAKRPVRAPLYTLAELAAEFDVSHRALASAVAHSKDAPKPKLSREITTKRLHYYDPGEVRAWWSSK